MPPPITPTVTWNTYASGLPATTALPTGPTQVPTNNGSTLYTTNGTGPGTMPTNEFDSYTEGYGAEDAAWANKPGVYKPRPPIVVTNPAGEISLGYAEAGTFTNISQIMEYNNLYPVAEESLTTVLELGPEEELVIDAFYYIPK